MSGWEQHKQTRVYRLKKLFLKAYKFPEFQYLFVSNLIRISRGDKLCIKSHICSYSVWAITFSGGILKHKELNDIIKSIR